MANTRELLRGLILSATDVKALTNWPDALVEDYINITDSLIVLAELADRKLEEIDTEFETGSVPFVDEGFLNEDNVNFLWDKIEKILRLRAIHTKLASIGNTQTSEWDTDGLYTKCPSVTFELEPLVSASTEGTLKWAEADHCPEYISGVGNTVQVGQEIWGIGVNKTGSTVLDGQVVYASGVQGQRLSYNFADAREGTKCAFVGIVTASTENNQEGPVTTFGLVHDIDTSAWVEGTKLYIAADNSGLLTAIAPDFPNFRLWVATVVYQHGTQGKVFVAPRIDFADGITLSSLGIINNFTALTAQFGNKAAGNYSEFEADGTYLAKGSATTFDDLQGSVLTLEAKGTRIVLNEIENTIDFATNTDLTDYLYGNFQVRHRWLIGSNIYPHLHWEQAQNAVPNFLIQYRWQLQGKTKVTTWTNYPLLSTVFTYTSGTLNQISIGLGITPPVGAGLSDVIEIRVLRDNANSSGEFTGLDLYTSAVSVTFADIHIEEDTLGSRQEYVK